MIRDLTQGKPGKMLGQFALPMFISVVFQQLYNIADSVIVGQFAVNGEDALAAVGVSYPITMIFMAVAVGCNVGCSVVVSQYFGARRYREMKTAISTTLVGTLAMALVMTVAGIVLTPFMLELIHTPENIFSDAALYLEIYIGGFAFLAFYNVVTGMFTSLGDSRTPLFFLIGSSLSNIVLDYLFVAGMHWDVAGVAWATFLCQGVACILAVITLSRRLKAIDCPETSEFFSLPMLRQILLFAIPSILQQSFISVGNLFVQNLVNGFDSPVIAGYSAAIKVNTFAVTCFTTVGSAVSNFSAQNIGAGRTDRVRQGLHAGWIMGLLIAAPFFCGGFFGGELLIRMFLDEESGLALATGVEFLNIVAPFYFVVCLKLSTDGLLRGSGAMKAFMIATFSDLILRVGIAYVLADALGARGIWLSWPIGWIVGTGLSLFFYLRGDWKKST